MSPDGRRGVLYAAIPALAIVRGAAPWPFILSPDGRRGVLYAAIPHDLLFAVTSEIDAATPNKPNALQKTYPPSRCPEVLPKTRPNSEQVREQAPASNEQVREQVPASNEQVKEHAPASNKQVREQAPASDEQVGCS